MFIHFWIYLVSYQYARYGRKMNITNARHFAIFVAIISTSSMMTTATKSDVEAASEFMADTKEIVGETHGLNATSGCSKSITSDFEV